MSIVQFVSFLNFIFIRYNNKIIIQIGTYNMISTFRIIMSLKLFIEIEKYKIM